MVADGLASVLGSERRDDGEISGLETYRRHLDAAVRNDAYRFESREAVVEAAIVWFTTRSEDGR